MLVVQPTKDVTVVVGRMMKIRKIEKVRKTMKKKLFKPRRAINHVVLYVTNEGCNCCSW